MLTDDDDDDYNADDRQQPLRPKRRRLSAVSFVPLLDQLADGTQKDFDDSIDNLLPEYLHARAILQEEAAESDVSGKLIRPLTRSEVSSFVDASSSKDTPPSPAEAIIRRKLKIRQERRRVNFEEINLQASSTVTPLTPPPPALPVNKQVIDALYSIQTTPFENSFLARLQGTRAMKTSQVIAVDWESVSPWMALMGDIREHYALAHPERNQPVETSAPITYTCLQSHHLDQVHDLLERAFWPGINVSDSLDHSPERCTVVVTYKRLVVGVAILSSPRETYITYLAVRAGWGNTGIARSMLYHLLTLNPNKDITLHVSVNNSAMLLYNRFGFKAEEFVAGFYEDYLDSQSRASKNAFRLRLRQQ